MKCVSYRFQLREEIMKKQTEINTQPELPFVPALSAGGSAETNDETSVVVPPAYAGGSDLGISAGEY